MSHYFQARRFKFYFWEIFGKIGHVHPRPSRSRTPPSKRPSKIASELALPQSRLSQSSFGVSPFRSQLLHSAGTIAPASSPAPTASVRRSALFFPQHTELLSRENKRTLYYHTSIRLREPPHKQRRSHTISSSARSLPELHLSVRDRPAVYVAATLSVRTSLYNPYTNQVRLITEACGTHITRASTIRRPQGKSGSPRLPLMY